MISYKRTNYAPWAKGNINFSLFLDLGLLRKYFSFDSNMLLITKSIVKDMPSTFHTRFMHSNHIHLSSSFDDVIYLLYFLTKNIVTNHEDYDIVS